MKKLLLLTGFLLAVAASSTLAQVGPGTGTNDPIYYNHSWTNYYDHDFDWGTNGLCLSNTPSVWSNKLSHAYAGQSQAGGGGQVQNRFGKSEVPADAQTMIQQFQQDRLQLMTQLKTASDAERQQILKNMEQLRTQLKERVQDMVQDQRDQVEGMQNRFRNRYGPAQDQGGTTGGGNSGGGADR